MQVKLGNRLRLLTYGTANNDRNFVELQRCLRASILVCQYALTSATGVRVWMPFALIM